MMTIYFVCYGNICRSPFADRYARAAIARRSLPDLAAESAGVGAVPGNPCPKPALVAAAELKVDLSSHLARHSHDISPGPGDLVVAMDRAVFGVLAENLSAPLSSIRGPGGSRLELMMRSLSGSASGAHGLDVPDPIGQGVGAYRSCYSLLARAVDSLLDRISAGELR